MPDMSFARPDGSPRDQPSTRPAAWLKAVATTGPAIGAGKKGLGEPSTGKDHEGRRLKY